MDKDTRNAIERATQRARKLLEDDFASQLEGTFDVLRNGTVAPRGGQHLTPSQAFLRDRIIASLDHKRDAGMSPPDAVADYLRDAAFTTLNRFAALKMLEARELVRPSVSRGEESAGYKEYCGLAPGVALLPDGAGYRLYIESLFDELATEVKVLFDRRDAASVLWPRRQTFEALLAILNGPELALVWGEDETIGWVYQFFNSGDERRAMRDASQAPRNSRELAVRNQFFTPRYVVQFLTDNTLGRIWYEMREGATALKDRCEYMVRRPNETYAPRTRKDPRDLRILDPACGSGHFLLYAFDLLVTIYTEAWSDSSSPPSEVTGKTLYADYADEASLRRAVPALILQHNLHGVDIDPRCAQIAQLALWIRAQRAFRDAGVGRAERPPIRRSNIIVSEPMPGDVAMVKGFAASLDPPFLGDLFTKIVSEMRLAGELGLLLRIDVALADAIGNARRQYAVREKELRKGFLPGFEPVAKQGELDLSGIDDLRFFERAETLVNEALRRFVGSAAGGAGARRRLFAEDAAQGFGLVEILEKQFDVVVMNPPFGEPSSRAKLTLDADEQTSGESNELAALFVLRAKQLLASHGMCGAITTSTLWFSKYAKRMRDECFGKGAGIRVGVELGAGVLDSALVETVLSVFEARSNARPTMGGSFCDISRAADKASALRAGGAWRFVDTRRVMAQMPHSTLAYWASASVLKLFSGERLESAAPERTVRHGLATSDDTRFVRLRTEVPAARLRAGDYVAMAKGGAFARFYYEMDCVVLWRDNGKEVKALSQSLYGSETRQIQAQEYYFRPGLTYPFRSQLGFSVRVLPSGSVFAVQGMAIFASNEDLLLEIMAVANSRVAARFADLIASFAAFQVGYVRALPYPSLDSTASKALVDLARRLVSLVRGSWRGDETCSEFVLPELLAYPGVAIEDRSRAFDEASRRVEKEALELAAHIDAIVESRFALSEQDVSELLGKVEGRDTSVVRGFAWALADDADTLGRRIGALWSWFVGVAFGRFDERLATGQRSIPREPKPFDPLPAHSPGMRPEGEPRDAPLPDILVDDAGHGRDLAAHVGGDMARVGVPEPDNLRTWLAREFFPLHIKMYSKSRRKAPIYWQLGTPSASYSVWLYFHALTPDTLYTVHRDYVAPKLAHEERKTEAMRAEHSAPGARERRALAEQEAFVDELSAYAAEFKLVTPLWTPHLDDGVVINAAPLWRLFAQYKAWQKELLAVWNSLCDGEYDWSHMAMHLWPERVVPKCAGDRSLAIAHGLEEVFWLEDAGGKWKKRANPTRPVAELVKERASAAVKAALKNLLDAPLTSVAARGRAGATRRTRTSRGNDT
jgi:hypothetical protein